MRNLKNYWEVKKTYVDPILKIRYGVGLGDFITAILHSKLIGPITYLITGKEKPCHSCNSRRIALNILFPIPFWRLFFKCQCDRNKSIQEFYKSHNVTILQPSYIPPNIPTTKHPKSSVEELKLSMDDLIKLNK